MFNFIAEKRNANNETVTGTYMNIIKEACSAVGDVSTVPFGSCPKNKADYIVCDTVQTAVRYYFCGCKNQIVWMQGVVPEESYMRRKSKLRYVVLSFMERFVLKTSAMLLLVSDDMLAHYEKKYRLKLKEKSVIMPCFNEKEIVNDAFLADKYESNTFLYVGSMTEWQCFSAIAEAYSKIEKTAENTMLYVYTYDKDTAKSIAEKYGIKNYTVDCVAKDELSDKIKNIKYGFVLRADCAVNNVATPTKFSNYIANGIIPIYSEALHSFADVDKKYNIGVVCNIDDLSAGVENIVSHMNCKTDGETVKEKCKKIFDEYYNREKYAEIIKKKVAELKTIEVR